MIDIIIPAYNAHKTIKDTLASIAMQKNVKDLNVYIIDDCSKESYEKECEIFKDILNIKLHRLDKNMGPGHARQYGIEHSNSKYIIFIDSDDLFFDSNSCDRLYNAIEFGKYDVVTGRILEIYKKKKYVYGERYDVLHAKIYRRSFINRKHIRFPNMFNSEDEAFNNFLLINKPKTARVEEITYVYKRRSKSLTMQEDYFTKEHIKCVCDNLKWTVKEAEKQNCDKEEIAKVIVNSFGYLYYYFYKNIKDKNLKYVHDIINIYKKYIKYIDIEEKRKIVLYWVSIFETYPMELSFDEFINKAKELKK